MSSSSTNSPLRRRHHIPIIDTTKLMSLDLKSTEPLMNSLLSPTTLEARLRQTRRTINDDFREATKHAMAFQDQVDRLADEAEDAGKIGPIVLPDVDSSKTENPNKVGWVDECFLEEMRAEQARQKAIEEVKRRREEMWRHKNATSPPRQTKVIIKKANSSSGSPDMSYNEDGDGTTLLSNEQSELDLASPDRTRRDTVQYDAKSRRATGAYVQQQQQQQQLQHQTPHQLDTSNVLSSVSQQTNREDCHHEVFAAPPPQSRRKSSISFFDLGSDPTMTDDIIAVDPIARDFTMVDIGQNNNQSDNNNDNTSSYHNDNDLSSRKRSKSITTTSTSSGILPHTSIRPVESVVGDELNFVAVDEDGEDHRVLERSNNSSRFCEESDNTAVDHQKRSNLEQAQMKVVQQIRFVQPRSVAPTQFYEDMVDRISSISKTTDKDDLEVPLHPKETDRSKTKKNLEDLMKEQRLMMTNLEKGRPEYEKMMNETEEELKRQREEMEKRYALIS